MRTQARGGEPFQRVWRAWAPTSVTAFCFSAALAAAVLAWSARSAASRDAWLAWASTNLLNLREHLIGSLVASAFLTDDQPLAWVALALIGLASAGRALGNARTAVVVALAHVLSTLLTESLLAHRIASGVNPVSDRMVVDVGPSYVVVSALAVGIAYGTWPARVASAVAFGCVAPYLFGGLLHGDIWALGHACAITLGLAIGFPLHRSWRRILGSAV